LYEALPNICKAFIYVMFSALSLDMVNNVHTILLEIQTNEKLFFVVSKNSGRTPETPKFILN